MPFIERADQTSRLRPLSAMYQWYPAFETHDDKARNVRITGPSPPLAHTTTTTTTTPQGGQGTTPILDHHFTRGFTSCIAPPPPQLDYMDLASLTTDPLKKARMGNAAASPGALFQGDAQFAKLKEFSVVYTGATLNLMAQEFQACMRDISSLIKECYNAKDFALIPGSGTFAMESVARQFATGKKTMIIRNGWFSYRWTQILEMAREPESVVLKAYALTANDAQSMYAPPKIEDVVAAIHKEKPGVVFAPHVETSTGMILTNEYIQAVGAACREVGAIFVLDCIASGAIWVDMQECNVDVLISAPQKAWSGPACCGFVLLQSRASEILAKTTSTSFACDLKQWVTVMSKYESGTFMYHTTLPTEALLKVRNKMFETREFGFENARRAQLELGRKIRLVLAERGFQSVAAPEVEAPGVVVVHTPTPEMVSRFARAGLQIAAGVKFMVDEHPQTQTFRVGLFGLEKWSDVDGTVRLFKEALNTALESNL